MPRVSKCNVTKLSPEDYKKCRSLCFRTEGVMATNLSKSKNWPELYDSQIYMIKDAAGKLLSWALVTEWDHEIHFYTRKSERRKGYGRRISCHIAKHMNIEEYSVDPHDDASEAFYSGTRYGRI